MKRFIIKGNVPSKKNSKEMCVRGGKPFIRVSDRYREWNENAVVQLMQQKKGAYFTECKICISFYYGDKRKRDIDNGTASIFDTLKDAGIIEDDNYQLIPKCYVESFYDKENPRAVVDIYEINEVHNIEF